MDLPQLPPPIPTLPYSPYTEAERSGIGDMNSYLKVLNNVRLSYEALKNLYRWDDDADVGDALLDRFTDQIHIIDYDVDESGLDKIDKIRDTPYMERLRQFVLSKKPEDFIRSFPLEDLIKIEEMILRYYLEEHDNSEVFGDTDEVNEILQNEGLPSAYERPYNFLSPEEEILPPRIPQPQIGEKNN